MAMFSRTTLVKVLEYFECLSHAELNLLFWEAQIPERIYINGNSKKEKLFSVFRWLENGNNWNNINDQNTIILKIIETGLAKIPQEDPENPFYNEKLDRQRRDVSNYLQRDGYIQGKNGIRTDSPFAEENRTALEVLVEKHSRFLDMNILKHHLKECEELYQQERWDSSIGQARNFIEKLLIDIASFYKESNLQFAATDLSRPIKVRQFLQKVGFFDKEEMKNLVEGVYHYLSNQGSHPGISDQSNARVCLHIIWGFGFYLLEKFSNCLGQ